MESIRPRLVLLSGGKKNSGPTIEGPITRLGLNKSVGRLTPAQWALIAGAKILLLGSLAYVMFG
jgi:hypothetical protein